MTTVTLTKDYQARDIESQVQDYWEQNQSFRVTENKDQEKFYCLSMFPYPSGRLHMGHVRNYTIGDMITRYQRMQGKSVLQPMGWDAFGLPAENAALKAKIAPAKWTYDNIAYMKNQLKMLGFGIDWSRELATCHADYYRWNQWLFLRMLERGIVYLKTGTVNWDPVDQTVLANEQVIEGRGWRTDALVEKREIPMYYMRITQYAEELLADLDKLPGWPERVKTMQANWIGKSHGVTLAFPYQIDGKDQKLWVFTTRADTLLGTTFCAVAAEHPLATRLAQDNPELARFIEECKQGSVLEADLATMDKKGIPTGFYVQHPLSKEPVEVWIGNYVLMSYGEGAVMGVPAHDERDFAFAKKYDLPIVQVIAKQGHDYSTDAWQNWYADKDNIRCVNSGKYDGLDFQAAVDAIAADLKSLDLGEKTTTWRLHDWGISRQRYWGTPIPIIHCSDCGAVPVPDEQLPVVLPEDLVPDGSGNPLAKTSSFVETTCPQCGKNARRETDTMDTFVDSSWYFIRYACADNHTAMVDERANYWLPVDQYIGGIEHAILHLLYARFWTKVMRDMDMVDCSEPFSHLLTQGMVLNHIFLRRGDKGGIDYFAPDEISIKHDAEGRITGATALSDGQPVQYDGMRTMSKSSRNGVDPQSLIETFGADTARFFIIFTSPPEQTLEWSDTGVKGSYRFLQKVWAFAYQHAKTIRQYSEPRNGAYQNYAYPTDFRQEHPEHAALRLEIHTHLQQASFDIQRQHFNTVASATMKMLNALQAVSRFEQESEQQALHESMAILIRVLGLITPHISHALWQELGYAGDILDSSWPQVDESALVRDTITLAVQVNGKLRGEINIPADADKASIEQAALNSPNAQRFVADKTVRKIIVVPGKLANIVCS